MSRPLTAVVSVLPTSIAQKPTSRARTLTAAPLRALEQRWADQLQLLTAWGDSHTSAAIARALAELREALEQAERQEARLDLKEAARRYSMATSTLTWICRRHGDEIGARKIRGEWSVDRAMFEGYLERQRGGTQ